MSDKIQILGSPLGMYSLLREDFVISILKDNGAFDADKLNKMLAKIADMGANALRDFFWIDTEEAYNKISPVWKKPDGSFEFNGLYFQNQKKIAEMCNRYNMRYYLSIFDHCGTKKKKKNDPGVWKGNPWRHFGDFFYGNDATDLRHKFIDRILEAFDGLDAGIEICNEPKGGAGEFLSDTFNYLINKGFDKQKIIIGVDYHLKEQGGIYGKDYRAVRDGAIEAFNNKEWAQWLKSECISPVHNATEGGIDDLWGGKAGPGGTRRILYSQDGVQNPRPGKNLMQQIAIKVLEKKTEAREKQKVHFEIIYGKTSNDPLDSTAGVSEAYKKIWGTYPANYGKFPQPLPLPDDVGETGSGPAPSDITPLDPTAPINSARVRHGYLGLLAREADKDGMKGYVKFLEGGGTSLEFCRKLIDSDEYRNKRANLTSQDLAHQFYKGILGRDPDSGGLTHTVELIEKGQTAERAAAMLDCLEFTNKFGG
ncbi:MAG: DUF4214 domain-containing protein [bacterium]|nr:DUF4214 domain-containing protein [bacterium]